MSKDSLYIIYAGPFRFPDGDAAAARVLNNARAMRMAGHRVEFLSYGGRHESEASSTRQSEFDGFEYSITHDIDRSRDPIQRRIVNFLVQGYRAYALLKTKSVPDVVILYNPALVMVVRMLFFARSRRIRLVADLTECYHSSEFPGGKWMPFAWMNELNIRWALRTISSKIVISSFLDHFYKSSVNLIVPPLVDINDKKWTRKSEVIPAFEGISCIYAGTPSGKDQVLFILDALKRVIGQGASVRLIFLGEGLDQLRLSVQSADFAMCRDFVVFPGKVPQYDVPAWYNTADFSLLFREHNRKNDAGFPTKFVESMAAGVPVIGNLTSDLGNYLVHDYNGFIVNEIDSKVLADLFVHLSKLNKSQLSNMKKAAKQTAVQYFDFRNHQERLNNFLSTTR